MFKFATRLLLLLAISLTSCDLLDSEGIDHDDQAELSAPRQHTDGEDDSSSEGGSGG